MKRILILSTLALLLVGVGCKPKDPPPPETPSTKGTLEVRFKANFAGQPFALNQVYTNVNGYKVSPETVRFLVHHFRVRNAAGEQTAKEAFQVNYASTSNTFTAELEQGTYTGVKFAIGVDGNLNHADPSLLPASHPFSINNAGNMHWSWATGYIFLKFEGKADTTAAGTGPVAMPWALHTGSNGLYREPSLNASFSISAGQTTYLNVDLDVSKMFYNAHDTIDIRYDNTTHSPNTLAERFANIYQDAFSAY